MRRRLTWVCSLLTFVVLAASGFDSYHREHRGLADALQGKLDTLAQTAAINVASGIEFDDRDNAAEFLDTIRTTMQLQAIAVYRDNGQRFAVAGDATLLPTTDDALPQDPIDWFGLATVAYRGPDGGTRHGSVVVRTSGQPLQQRLAEHLRRLLVAGAAALLTLWLCARWFLGRLLRPVARLVETTQRVRETEDYSLRATASADDEVGALVHSFNAMLQVIQERDRHLAGAAARLELQVRERTAELSRALDAAEAATRAKSTFLANMSHEIRTPLNAVLGMAELALDTEDPRELREYLGVIRSAGTNLLGILCDILDLSKIESDKLELSLVPTDVESLTLDTLRPLTSRIQSKNLELSLVIGPDLARGYQVDDVRLRQVLTNLVGNAIKFTPHGEVQVALHRRSSRGDVHELELVVQDTGVGIPADRLDAVFTPFTQADSTITRRFAGTGLGLAITDRLVRLMGGSIHVESQVGVGTTFRVRLPFAVGDSPLPAIPTLPSTTRLLLLAVADATARSIRAIAQRLGITVELLADPLALARLGRLGPHDYVLLDCRDPDGDEALAAAVPPGPGGERAILLVTSFQDLASAAARCRNHQFAGYLPKPIAARELAARLSRRSPDQSADASSAQASSATAKRGLRILVAEDNAVNQKLIERILQRDGHQVTLAENGRICVELWQQGKFDLVLMDMQMPEVSGIEAAAQIRRAEANSRRRTPIVALTANTTPEDRSACLNAGMDDVLPKPVSMPRLRAAMQQYVPALAAAPDQT